jgi:hypothetical protein
VALVCAIVLSMVGVYTVIGILGCLSCLSLRIVHESSSGSVRTSKFVSAFEYCHPRIQSCTRKMYMKFRPSLLFQCLALAAAIVSTYSQAFRKLIHFTGPNSSFLCGCLSVGNEFGYILSKLSTTAFLGTKASLNFIAGPRSSNFWGGFTVGITTLFSASFLFVMIFALVGASFFVDSSGNCSILVSSSANIALTVVDVVSNVVLFLFFVIPMRANLGISDAALTKHTKSSFRDTLLQNAVMGIITTVSAGICLGTVAAFTTSTNGEGLLIGCLTSVDLTINCICQLISTRRIWEIQRCSNNQSSESDDQMQFSPSREESKKSLMSSKTPHRMKEMQAHKTVDPENPSISLERTWSQIPSKNMQSGELQLRDTTLTSTSNK